MAAQSDPYSRFYWRFRDEYADIYADKEAFGWWMTLLANAEGTHPSAPEMPRSIKPKALSRLVSADLIELLPGDRYRMKGVAKEMERRSKQGKAGADARWMRSDNASDTNALPTHSEGTANAMPRRDKTRRDETRQDEAAHMPVLAWLRSHGVQRIVGKVLNDLMEIAAHDGADALIAAMERLHQEGRAEDAAQFVYGARNALHPIPSAGRASKPNSPHLADLQAATEVV